MSVQARRAFEADQAACPAPYGTELPVIAVHGFAIGGGLTLAAVCDIIITSPADMGVCQKTPSASSPARDLGTVEQLSSCQPRAAPCWGLHEQCIGALVALPPPRVDPAKYRFTNAVLKCRNAHSAVPRAGAVPSRSSSVRS